MGARTYTKAEREKYSKMWKNRWQDPEYRRMMIEKQIKAGLRNYRK